MNQKTRRIRKKRQKKRKRLWLGAKIHRTENNDELL